MNFQFAENQVHSKTGAMLFYTYFLRKDESQIMRFELLNKKYI